MQVARRSETYTLSLHDALPILGVVVVGNKTTLRIITVIPLEEESVVPGPGERERGIEYEVHASQVTPIARDSDAGPIAQDVPRVGPKGGIHLGDEEMASPSIYVQRCTPHGEP